MILRSVIFFVWLMVATGCSAGVATESADESVLTLLGTRGGPTPQAERAGIASLVSVGDRHYLIDAGAGVTGQLAKAGISVKAIEHVFLTHLHDDHTASLPELMTTSQMTPDTTGLTIHGPPQTDRLVTAANAFLSVNADIRNAESGGRVGAPADLFKSREIGEGVVFDDGVVKVTAVENTHYILTLDEVVERTASYAYRFDTPIRSIVFTGDTGPSGAVEKLAAGADILVAEMVSADDIASVPPFVRDHMLAEHLTATEVGKLASKAGVKLLVASHLGHPTDDDLKEIVRHFNGRIVFGEDLQRF